MSDWIEYKGYIGSVHYSDQDETFNGKLEGISDLVTYEGADVRTLTRAFHEGVDDYLALCKKNKKAPQVPFKGTFNVRVGPALHRLAATYAAAHQTKLNAVVAQALDKFLELA